MTDEQYVELLERLCGDLDRVYWGDGGAESALVVLMGLRAILEDVRYRDFDDE